MDDILSRFEKICMRFPDRIAVGNETSAITYHNLKKESRMIASGLFPYNFHNKPIAIYMDKSPECITAMLGVMQSGNFYVIIDTEMPVERVRSIFETLKPSLVLTRRKHLMKIGLFSGALPISTYEELIQNPVDRDKLFSVRKRIIDTDPVYAIYTSGSTGRPKGALVNYRALSAYTDWFTNEFAIDETTVFGSQTPLYFSMSVSDLFGALTTGATYQIIPKKHFTFSLNLIDYMNLHHINTIYWVPSALCIVANWDTFSYSKPEYLKKVLFAGESMPCKQLNYWRKHFPDLMYANLFGPTETTDICCFYVVDRDFSDDESLPIGRPCNNCGIIIIDENGKESTQGELMVKGSFLASGYYNDPEKTSKAFIQNPLVSAYPEIVYRTGDLVRREENGELSYLGRKDFQIKHMGYRIELGEIEACVGAMPEMKSCACIYDNKKDQIILFYQGKAKLEHLTSQISEKLPSYMRPNRYIPLKQMPYNNNGKIDRTLLNTMY